jgi:uncharacterized protein involved in exopolysaccharide biosynthesis
MAATRPQPLQALLKKLPRILRDAAIVAVVVFAGSFLFPNEYQASSSILPPADASELGGLLSTMPGAIALSRGLGIDGGGQTDVYLGVLKSERTNRALVERFELGRTYRVSDAEKAGRELRKRTAIHVTDEGLLRVTVTDRDRGRSARLANAYVEELDRFLRTNTSSTARRRREFLERRLAETRPVLERAENALRDYQVRARLPMTADADRAAAAAGELVAEKVRLEIELGTLESVSRVSQPRAAELANQIRQIEHEIIKLPAATTALARLYREVMIQERVLLILTEEYERARLIEHKNVPVVEVLDVAEPPIHKSSPRRAVMGVAAFVLAAGAFAMLALARSGAFEG